MKRWLVLLLILVLVVSVAACRPRGTTAFGIEAGRAAFVQQAEPTTAHAVARSLTLAEGASFVADWGDMGVLASKVLDETTYYGVERASDEVLPYRFIQLECTGHYYVARRYNDEGLSCEVYDRGGTLLTSTVDTAASVAEISPDYFLLYTYFDAQLYDAHGQAQFHEGVLSTSDVVSACDGYFLSFDSDTGAYCVWDGPNVLRHRFDEAGVRYSVAYMGGKFLVTALTTGTADNYTYIEAGPDTMFVRQQAWWYDPVADSLSATQLDYVLLSVTNVYTPGLGVADKQELRLQQGYSVATVAELNNYAVHISQRHYVIDGAARRMVRYPVGINATAICYRSDMGFVSSAAAGGAAVLYDLAGNMVWQDKNHSYAMMCWQSGRFVASYMDEGVTRYGAFDSAGEVAIPFRYAYLSPFVDNRCVARLDGVYYVLSDAGERLGTVSIACPEHWLAYGVYVYVEGGRYGVKNFAGEVVVPPTWQRFVSIGYNAAGEVYLVASTGEAQTLLVLQ